MLITKNFGPVTKIKMARTIAGSPLYTTNAYFVDDLLIDTGCPHAGKDFEPFIKEKNIEKCIITHHHEDHSGNGFIVQDHFGITPLAHQQTPKLFSELKLRPYQRLCWGWPKSYTMAPIPKTVETEKYKFNVIEAPGHSSDMIVLHEASEGWLFSSDLYISPKIRFLRDDEDIHLLMRSMRLILELDFDTLFCSHRPIEKGGKDAIKKKLEYYQDLFEHVRDFYGKGLTPEKIRKKTLGPEGFLTWFTGGHFSKLNLIKSLLSPLIDKTSPAV